MTDPPEAEHFNDIYIVTNLMETDLGRSTILNVLDDGINMILD